MPSLNECWQSSGADDAGDDDETNGKLVDMGSPQTDITSLLEFSRVSWMFT